MSIEEKLEALERLLEKPEAKAEFDGCEDADALQEALTKHGIEFTDEEFEGLLKAAAAMGENSDGELDLESLDEVSGGWRMHSPRIRPISPSLGGIFGNKKWKKWMR